MDNQVIKERIVQFIRTQAGDKPVILGLSGGVDSALTACLAVEAVGQARLKALFMPSATNSAEDARLVGVLAKQLDLDYKTINIDNLISVYEQAGDFFANKKSLGNLKARIRMSLLYGQANAVGGLVLGTGNKSELLVGYFTKHGDGGVDLLPLGDLYKTQVRELAIYLNLPAEIIERAPSAGLWAGQTDEQELGISYQELDKILSALENNDRLDNFPADKVALVEKYMSAASHKQKLPPICFFEGVN